MGVKEHWGKVSQNQMDHSAPEVNRDHEGLQTVLLKNETVPLFNGDYKSDKQDPIKSKILGLTVRVFWGVVIVLVIAIAAGIGAGVGIGLSSQKKSPTCVPNSQATNTAAPAVSPTSKPNSPISTPTSSPTSSAPSTGPSPQIITPCIADQGATGKVLTAQDSTGVVQSAWTLQCNTNYPEGEDHGNKDTLDLMALWVPDMTSCIDTCAMWNRGHLVASSTIPKCVAVAVVRGPGAYCYLKSGTGKNDTSTSNGLGIDSAVLIPS